MKKTKRTIKELESIVLNMLVNSLDSVEEIRLATDKLNPDLWTRDHRKILDCITDYANREPNKGKLLDVLTQTIRPVTPLLKIMQEFVPIYVGKDAIAELNYKQEESLYQQKIRSLVGKPLKQIKPELDVLIKRPLSIYRPKKLAEVGKERLFERELEKNAGSTGYPELDFFVKGFVSGHCYILSGATNAGKSAMAANFSVRLSQQGKKVLYFALEPENTIADYFATIRNKKRFIDLTPEEIAFDDPNIDIFGKEQVREVEDLVRAIYALPRYDLIVVDHLGYFTAGTTNLTSRQSDVMKQLAALAKDRQSAILIIQHLNKSKTNKANPEDNITGSAAFKQDATDVLILIRDTEEDEYGAKKTLNTGALLIRKTKTENPEGVVKLRFIKGSAVILGVADQAREF